MCLFNTNLTTLATSILSQTFANALIGERHSRIPELIELAVPGIYQFIFVLFNYQYNYSPNKSKNPPSTIESWDLNSKPLEQSRLS